MNAVMAGRAESVDAPIVGQLCLPTMPYRYYWEDFPAGLVRDFGAMPVTHDAVVAFAREFDPQPFHVDDEAGRDSLFGGLCASGWHTCAMAMRMMCDAYLLDSASLGSPGLDALVGAHPARRAGADDGRLEHVPPARRGGGRRESRLMR
jgi:acyl dehydratase